MYTYTHTVISVVSLACIHEQLILLCRFTVEKWTDNFIQLCCCPNWYLQERSGRPSQHYDKFNVLGFKTNAGIGDMG